MATICVSIEIAASPKQVWDVVKDISDHVNWMKDAERIDFLTEKQSGVGTMFDCATKVGPFRLKDKMEITEWVDEKSMGVSHEGLVTGSGRFSLAETNCNGTLFTWEETLHFPFWMGGPLRNPVGTRLLALIWKKNLKLLKEQVEGSL
ncbi:MAG: SRPBCC family protein [Actinomycetota bacterium]|nr:SRPBCC family protein [Actinomycetota bacterium]